MLELYKIKGKDILKYIKIIVVIFLSVSILSASFAGINVLLHKPKSSKYITGYIYGNLKEKIQTDFRVKTFDEKGILIRDDLLDLYNLGNFVLEFIDNEATFFIYESAHSYGYLEPGVKTISNLHPNNLFDIKMFNKQKIRYVQNTVYIKQ